MEDIEIGCEVFASTPLAIGIENLHGEKTWIPRSQISDYTGEDLEEATSIFIPEWLATEKELI